MKMAQVIWGPLSAIHLVVRKGANTLSLPEDLYPSPGWTLAHVFFQRISQYCGPPEYCGEALPASLLTRYRMSWIFPLLNICTSACAPARFLPSLFLRCVAESQLDHFQVGRAEGSLCRQLCSQPGGADKMQIRNLFGAGESRKCARYKTFV